MGHISGSLMFIYVYFIFIYIYIIIIIYIYNNIYILYICRFSVLDYYSTHTHSIHSTPMLSLDLDLAVGVIVLPVTMGSTMGL